MLPRAQALAFSNGILRDFHEPLVGGASWSIAVVGIDGESKMPIVVRQATAKRATRSAAWRVIDGIGMEAMSIVFFIILGRLLGPADFGVVAIAGIFIMGGQIILRHGFGDILVQMEVLESADMSTAFWLNLAGSMMLAIGLAALAWPLSIMFSKPLLFPVTILLAPVLLISGVAATYHALLRRNFSYGRLALSSNLSVLCGGGLATAAALFGLGIWSLVVQQIAATAMALAILLASTPWRPSWRYRLSSVRRLTGTAMHVVIAHLADLTNRRIDTIGVGYFLPAETAGIYFLASRVSLSLGRIVYMPISDISLSVFSRIHPCSVEHREAIYRVCRLTSLITLPVAVGAAFLAVPVVELLFGEEWRAAATPLQILCMFGVFYVFTVVSRQVLVASGGARTAGRLSATAACASVVLVFGIASHGLGATAIAVGLSYVFGSAAALSMLRQAFGVRVRRILFEQSPIWIAAAAMCTVLAMADYWGLLGAGPMSIVGKVFLGALTFLGGMALAAPKYLGEVHGLLKGGVESPVVVAR